MKQATVVLTSPFGRRGDVVEVDPDSPRVIVYVQKGLLAYQEDDQEDRDTSGADEGPDAPEALPEASGGVFDPSQHTVREVEEYLETADDEEWARVLEAERVGKGRVSLVG